MSMEFKKKLPTAEIVKGMYPITEEMAEQKRARDEAIRSILTGQDRRLLLIIGPCSADREDSVLEYISRLQPVQEATKDKLLIIPRIYTNKPRTTGEGYKGMLHQPDPTSSPDMYKGIISIRKIHMRALEHYGFSCADEMLYPENHNYLSDLLAYVAVGARSVEDQQHRLTASGVDIPVGMKNPTGGDLSVMMNAIHAAQHGHTFVYNGWETNTSGNPLSHAILRGYTSKHGGNLPNYHFEDLRLVSEMYAESHLQNPAVIVDCNHSNSSKQWQEQPRIAKEVFHSMRHSADVGRLVKGLMIESYLEDGAQKPGGCVYGQSITDPCLGWEKSEKLIYELAEQL